MTAAARGNPRDSGYARDELDWYVEPRFVVEQLLDHEDFSAHVVYDPACGQGNILDVCVEQRIGAIGSDVEDRGASARHFWFLHNFLTNSLELSDLSRHVMPFDLPSRRAIICNPPYGRLEHAMPRGDTYAERFIRRARSLGADKVAMLVNGKFLWSERRWRLFHEDHPPTQILFCSDRPSMPPGKELHRLHEIGRAYTNGSIDYVWLLWVKGEAPRPPAWLRPRKEERR